MNVKDPYKVPASILLHGWNSDKGEFIELVDDPGVDEFRRFILITIGKPYAMFSGRYPWSLKGKPLRDTDNGLLEIRRIFTTLFLYTKKIRVGKKSGFIVHKSDIVCPDGRDPEDILKEVRECLESNEIKVIWDVLDQIAKIFKKQDDKPAYRTSVPFSVHLSQPKNSDPNQLSIPFQDRIKRTLKDIRENGDYRVEHQTGADLFLRNGKPLPFKADHYKLINALRVTLGEISGNISRQDEEDFYRGNLPDLIRKGEGRVPLQVSITHLARNYGNGKKAESKDIKHVENLIRNDFENPQYWIVYDVSSTVKKDGRSVQATIPELAPIVRFQLMTIKVQDDQGTEEQTTEILSVHPLFAHEIENKYAFIPPDLNDRLRIAWGKPQGQISVVAYKLFEILLMGTANPKRNEHEEGVEKLYKKVNPQYWEKSRKDLIRGQVEEAIEAWTRLGLIQSYRIEPGGPKYVFKLNKDWYK